MTVVHYFILTTAIMTMDYDPPAPTIDESPSTHTTSCWTNQPIASDTPPHPSTTPTLRSRLRLAHAVAYRTDSLDPLALDTFLLARLLITGGESFRALDERAADFARWTDTLVISILAVGAHLGSVELLCFPYGSVYF